jgi:hypothetical protein
MKKLSILAVVLLTTSCAIDEGGEAPQLSTQSPPGQSAESGTTAGDDDQGEISNDPPNLTQSDNDPARAENSEVETSPSEQPDNSDQPQFEADATEPESSDEIVGSPDEQTQQPDSEIADPVETAPPGTRDREFLYRPT